MSTETTTTTNETKQQTGVRLANARMQKIQAGLKGIGNLGSYGLSKGHVSQIEKALDKWVAEAKAKLNNRKDDPEEGFKLQ